MVRLTKIQWEKDTMDNSPEIDLYWDKIRNSVDELVACLEGLDSDSLNWKPLDDANSLYVLATHTMGNVRHNFLSILCGAAHHQRPRLRVRGYGGISRGDRSGLERPAAPDFGSHSGNCRPVTWTV